MDLADYRTASLETWNRVAPGWHEHRDMLWNVPRRVGQWLVDHADPQPGETVLELACGAADTGFAAAARGARLIATDFSPEMVEIARRRAAELGVEDAEFRIMDAETMDLEDDSVDCVVCRFGYMLMADPLAALRETRRVLRAGGRLAFAVWTTPQENPWGAVPGLELVERGHMPMPEPGQPGIFALGEEDRLRSLVEEAGLELAELEGVEVEWRFDDFDSAWQFLTDVAGPLAVVIAALPEGERASVREAVERRMEPFRSNGGYVEPGRTWCVLAR